MYLKMITKQKYGLVILLLSTLLIVSCEGPDLIQPVGFETAVEADSIIFAQIGDFGYAGTAEGDVAKLVDSWKPDFIISVGDNNYSEGLSSTLKSNISNYYGDYIYNYDASPGFRCNGKAFEDQINRFFPTPGNHDANNRDGLVPYYNFFTLPHNEIYYKFSWGPVTFYSINALENNLEEQKAWLEQELTLSSSPFNIVFSHYPPYSSGVHGNIDLVRWDYYNMGVDVMFTGHDHIYERTERVGEEGMYYIVNGLGGRAANDCVGGLSPELFNSLCFGGDYGAVKCTATLNKLILEFYAVSSPGQPIDRIEITK